MSKWDKTSEKQAKVILHMSDGTRQESRRPYLNLKQLRADLEREGWQKINRERFIKKTAVGIMEVLP